MAGTVCPNSSANQGLQGVTSMFELEERYPPDVLFGGCGTGQSQVRRMLNENRHSLLGIKGET
jgi:hypothetical protein